MKDQKEIIKENVHLLIALILLPNQFPSLQNFLLAF